MREWLVIESSFKRTVFASDEQRTAKPGYIPRDVAEPLLGRKIATGNNYEWFTREEGDLMRNHPEWRDDLEDNGVETQLDEIRRLGT